MGIFRGRRRRGLSAERNSRRQCRPEVLALETRALLSVNPDWTVINPVPRVLPNLPGGPQLPIEVSGVVASNKSVAPAGLYYVIDEYHADEPRGTIALTPIGLSKQKLYQYAYDFQITLQARRSTHTPDGRFYNLFVGGTDGDGTNGKIIRLIVPKNFAAALRPAPVVKPITPTPHHRKGVR